MLNNNANLITQLVKNICVVTGLLGVMSNLLPLKAIDSLLF